MAGAPAFGEPPGMSEHVNEQAAVKRLERSRSDRMLAGVCGGLARYFELNPAFYRVGFVVLTLLGGAGVLIYLAAALVIPEEGRPDSVAAEVLRQRRDRPWPLVGLALVAVAGAVLLSRATLWPRGDAAWILLLLAGGVILWSQRRRRAAALTPAPAAEATAPAPASSRRLLRGISITAGVLLVLALISAAIVATVFRVDVRNGIGNRTYQPAGPADLQRHYRLGIGDLGLDLSGVRIPAGETKVDARVGIGKLSVTVPPNVALRVNAKAQIGTVEVLGRTADGRNAGVTVDGNGNGDRVLVLSTRVGFGVVKVARSLR
jgi:phage shock protein PspC (stress-responsive transcriptional regulator)